MLFNEKLINEKLDMNTEFAFRVTNVNLVQTRIELRYSFKSQYSIKLRKKPKLSCSLTFSTDIDKFHLRQKNLLPRVL